MKTDVGVKVITAEFLTSKLGGCKWPASRPGRFTPGERAHDTYRVGVVCGSQSRYAEHKNLALQGIEPSAVKLVARRYTY
jgi:ABC-type uncharacterized transport system auxiliary subunit